MKTKYSNCLSFYFLLHAQLQHVQLQEEILLVVDIAFHIKKCSVFSNPGHNLFLEDIVLMFPLQQFIFLASYCLISILLDTLIVNFYGFSSKRQYLIFFLDCHFELFLETFEFFLELIHFLQQTFILMVLALHTRKNFAHLGDVCV